MHMHPRFHRTRVHIPPREDLHRLELPMAVSDPTPLVTALRAGSCHAAVCIRDMCQDTKAVPSLLRAGAIGALIAATGSANPAKLRGWSLSALAIIARSDDPATQRALPEALPSLLSALQSAPPECRAWAAEAMATICSHADASSALAVRLGAVPHLTDSLPLARASAAGEAVARSALAALVAIVRVSAGRAQLLAKPDGVECAVALLLVPALAAAAAELVHELCRHGGSAAARQVLLCASLAAALPLLLYPAPGQGHRHVEGGEHSSSLRPTRVALRAAAAPFLSSSPASVPNAAKHLTPSQSAALRSLRVAAHDLLVRATADSSATLQDLMEAVDALLPPSSHPVPSARQHGNGGRQPLGALVSPNAAPNSRTQTTKKPMTADHADRANHADHADRANHDDHADRASHDDHADRASHDDRASHADHADHANHADHDRRTHVDAAHALVGEAARPKHVPSKWAGAHAPPHSAARTVAASRMMSHVTRARPRSTPDEDPDPQRHAALAFAEGSRGVRHRVTSPSTGAVETEAGSELRLLRSSVLNQRSEAVGEMGSSLRDGELAAYGAAEVQHASSYSTPHHTPSHIPIKP